MRMVPAQISVTVAEALARFATIHPYHLTAKRLGTADASAVIREYAEVLADLPALVIENAAIDLRAEGEHFPTPAEWRRKALENRARAAAAAPRTEDQDWAKGKPTPHPDVAAKQRAMDAAIEGALVGLRRVVDIPAGDWQREALLAGWALGRMERTLRMTIADRETPEEARENARTALAAWMRYEFPAEAVLADTAERLAREGPLPTSWGALGTIGDGGTR
jgi:hypothetical protein